MTYRRHRAHASSASASSDWTPILALVSRREVDTLAFATLWTAALMGGVLIAVHGGDVVAMTILWLDLFLGAVLLALLASDDVSEAEAAAGAGLLPFVVSGFFVLVYVAAAGVALGSGVVAAFVGGSTIAAGYLLFRDRPREQAPPMSAAS
jgi:hypothetical protein